MTRSNPSRSPLDAAADVAPTIRTDGEVIIIDGDIGDVSDLVDEIIGVDDRHVLLAVSAASAIRIARRLAERNRSIQPVKPVLSDPLSRGLHAFAERLSDLALTVTATEMEWAEVGREAAEWAVNRVRWHRQLGDALTTSELCELLRVSRQALHQRVQAGTLLGVPAQSTTLYPVWQLRVHDGAGTVRSAVSRIITTFRERLGDEYRALNVASWATSPQPELDGITPAVWLSQNRDEELVVRAAGHAAALDAR